MSDLPGPQGTPLRDYGAAPVLPVQVVPDPMEADPTDRDAARTLLVHVVQQHRRQGQQHSTAAGVSSQMRSRSPAFNFAVLGYRSFRDLLREADEQGAVDVTWPERRSGLDAYVWLPGEEQVPPPPRSSERPPHVKTDLWRAFMHFDANSSRYWDRKTGQVVGSDVAAQDVHDLIPITPIRIENQIEWMRTFTAALDSSAQDRQALENALAQDRPAGAFASAVRQFPATETQWRRSLVEHVTEVVERWKTSHGLNVDILDDHAAKPTHTQRAGRARRGAGELNDEEIRGRVIAAVRAMPMSDVLQLRLPVEYLLIR